MNSLIRSADNITFESSPKYSYIFSFEENFDQAWSSGWMVRNWSLSIILDIVYLTIVFFGPIFMQNRDPLKLKVPLTIWNLSLAIFSTCGAIRLYPEFVHILTKNGFHASVCDNKPLKTNKISAFWLWLFILSKAPELLDTLFIVLRKRKLVFLHWFHHSATLCFTWYIYQEQAAIGRVFAISNLSVHAIMYLYFSISTMNVVKIPRFVAMLITSAQIAQMILGTYVSLYAYAMHVTGVPCAISTNGGRSAVLIYGVHFFLFVKLFSQSYLKKNKRVKND